VHAKTIIGYDPDHGGADALALGRLLGGLISGAEVVETDALSALAKDDGAAVIVIGSSHRGPVGRTLLGAEGESLAHGAGCAIAVAPRGYADGQPDEIGRIAVAYDASPEATVALETATAIAERAGARLTVLTVADYPRYNRTAALSLLSEGEIHDRAREEHQKLVDEAVAGVPEPIAPSGRVLVGDPARELAKASADFDLIVAGSRSHGPLRRTLLGSATRRLLSDSACPVLVMPRGAEPLR
jgi:nucleotide-binding universal stress UspA family protein